MAGTGVEPTPTDTARQDAETARRDADRAAAERLLARLEELEASGAVDLLTDVVGALKALLDSTTPGLVARVAAVASQAVELADELIYHGQPTLPVALRALGEAVQEARGWKRAPGWFRLAAMASDPDTRRGLAFMLAFARHLGRRLAA